MKAILQRVTKASLRVEGKLLTSIAFGLVILVSVKDTDTLEQVTKMAEKISKLRFINDEAGKINYSLLDKQGEILLIPQFSLYADLKKGHRPSFSNIAEPELAQDLFKKLELELKSRGLIVFSGIFGANMEIALVNQGPLSFILEY